jgi:murein DD-endopeptidase MepM/ murein hydrolase activator NlpD
MVIYSWKDRIKRVPGFKNPGKIIGLGKDMLNFLYLRRLFPMRVMGLCFLLTASLWSLVGAQGSIQITPNLVSNGQFVYGPNLKGFDLSNYLASSAPHLSAYSSQLSEHAEYYSINPKILLTLMEMTTSIVSDRKASGDKIENPFNLPEKGFIAQSDRVFEVMFDAYYLHLNTYSALPADQRSLPGFTLKDGTTYSVPSSTNAGTYAVIAALALLREAKSIDQAVDNPAPGSFYRTYMLLFNGDNPLDESNHIPIPGELIASPLATSVGIMQLPFLIGESWQFDGVHSWGGNNGTDMSSIDFSPGWPPFGSDTSQKWVVAAAAGVPTKISACWFKIVHPGGWETHYYHIEGILKITGTIERNQKIGVIANTSAEATCSGGSAKAAHLHFGLKYNGAWAPIGNSTLSGWLVHPGRYAYDYNKDYMWLERGGVKTTTYQWLLNDGGAPTEAAILTAPLGLINSVKPTYQWNVVDRATDYRFILKSGDGVTLLDQWYLASNLCSAGVCSLTNDSNLLPNKYSWWIKTRNAIGSGIWSAEGQFIVPAPPDAKATLVYPTGSITQLQPTFKWHAVDRATTYKLKIIAPSGELYNTWVVPTCDTSQPSICTYTPDVLLLESGAYTWFLRSANGIGGGLWSDVFPFNFTLLPPDTKSIPLSPTPSTISSAIQPFQLSWKAVDRALSYKIKRVNVSGSAVNDSVTAKESCKEGVCTMLINQVLPDGAYRWSVIGTNPAGDGPASDESTFTLMSPPTSTPVTVSPTGPIQIIKPTYSWYRIEFATEYQVQINNASGAVLYQNWAAESVVCPVGEQTCAITPDLTLQTGFDYTWSIQARNAVAATPWSTPVGFKLLFPPTQKVILTSPGVVLPGSIKLNASQVEFNWTGVEQATWYKLSVESTMGEVFTAWFKTADVCVIANCTAKPTLHLGDGQYTWKILVWNEAGYGPWSDSLGFILNSSPELLVPSGKIATLKTAFSWNGIAGVSWYKLLVEKDSVNVYSAWFDANLACTALSCTVNPDLSLQSGVYNWKIQPWSPDGGYMNWSTPLSFEVLPTIPVLLSPIGSITESLPTFTWNVVPGMVWYKLMVSGPNGIVINQWYEASTQCNGTTCSLKSGIVLTDGSYIWKVLPWNNQGYGQWSSEASFDLKH